MRLYKYLQEAVIHPDLKWLDSLKPKILQNAVGKSKDDVLGALNKLFSERFVEFIPVSARVGISDELTALGIINGKCFTEIPFKIEIYLNKELMGFSTKEIFNYWFENIKGVLGHELIHREQLCRARIIPRVKYSQNGQINWHTYYADKREIMAIAYEVLCWMMYKGYKKLDMLSMIRSVKDLSAIDLINVKEFIDEYPPKTPEHKLFSKYVYQYIAQ